MEPIRPEMLPYCTKCGKVQLLRMQDGDAQLGEKCYLVSCDCTQGMPGSKKQVKKEWKEHIQKSQNNS